jgi:small-conductance mechanosensitive channel
MKPEAVVDFLKHTSIGGNLLWRWALAVALAAALIPILMLMRKKISQHVEQFASSRNSRSLKILGQLLSRTNLAFLVILAAWAGLLTLSLSASLTHFVNAGVSFTILLQAAFWVDTILMSLLAWQAAAARAAGAPHSSAFGVLKFLFRTILWTVAVLFGLEMFNVNISALLTGVSIGGIAIALAVQNVLGDVICSVSIVLDEPFQVGDFIIVGDLMGTVEQIGIKSTRLTSLSGEQLIVPNSSLISSQIKNYKRMAERRVVFSVGVTYDTPPDKVEAIPQMLKDIVCAQSPIRFDRAHFSSLTPSSLNFEVVYYVLSKEYNVFMDIQQDINFKILRRFAEEKIDFAYPTQTIFLNSVTNAGDGKNAAAG